MEAWHLMVLGLLLALVVGGCSWVTREPELSPQEVVTKFYRWYIGCPGNPLVDREYRESSYLAESYVKEIDEVLEGGIYFDPILLAQDIPERFTVEELEISGDEATVMVSLYWSGNDTPSVRRVDLELIDGAWKIRDVSMVEPLTDSISWPCEALGRSRELELSLRAPLCIIS